MNELNDLIETLISTRDFCGDEQQALKDWQADNRKLSAKEVMDVWRMFEILWNKNQVSAGVKFPIHPDERRAITKILNRS